MLYSNPQFWWPWFERLRLAFVSAGPLRRRGGRAPARLGRAHPHRRLGRRRRSGPTSPSSRPRFAWTLSEARHPLRDGRGRGRWRSSSSPCRTWWTAARGCGGSCSSAALASLGPGARVSIEVWRTGDALVDGFRTHWRGPYADPNRLAMALVAVLPFALYGAVTARRRRSRLLFGGVAAAQLAAIVLTHSRSGSIAAGVAVLLFIARGRGGGGARGRSAAVAIALGLAAFAPDTFWQRSSTLANLEADESVQGRENAWKVLGVIVEERPLTGVGAGRVHPGVGPLRAARGRGAPVHRAQRPARDRGRARRPRLRPLLRVLRVAPRCGCGRAGADPLVGRRGAGGVRGARRRTSSRRWRTATRSRGSSYFLFACAVAVVRTARRAGERSRGRRRDGADEGARVPEPVPARRPGAADGDERPDDGPDPLRAGGRVPQRGRRALPDLAEVGDPADRSSTSAPRCCARGPRSSSAGLPASSGRTGSPSSTPRTCTRTRSGPIAAHLAGVPAIVTRVDLNHSVVGYKRPVLGVGVAPRGPRARERALHPRARRSARGSSPIGSWWCATASTSRRSTAPRAAAPDAPVARAGRDRLHREHAPSGEGPDRPPPRDEGRAARAAGGAPRPHRRRRSPAAPRALGPPARDRRALPLPRPSARRPGHPRAGGHRGLGLARRGDLERDPGGHGGAPPGRRDRGRRVARARPRRRHRPPRAARRARAPRAEPRRAAREPPRGASAAGSAGGGVVEREFGVEQMRRSYDALYEDLTGLKVPRVMYGAA